MSGVGESRGRLARLWHTFDGLAADTLWSGAHDLIVLVQALVSFSLLNDTLTRAQYGAYIGAWGLIGSIGAFTSGIGLALLQRVLGERDDPSAALRSFLSLALASTAAGAALVLLASTWSIDLATWVVGAMVGGELIALGVITVAGFLVQAVAGFQAAVRLRIVVVVMRFVVVTGLAVTGNLTVPNLVLGHLVGLVAWSFYVLVVVLPRHGVTVQVGRPSGLAVRSTSLFAAPMVASKAQTDFDKYLLPTFGHKDDGGLYGAAYRVLMLGAAPLGALDNAAFQRFLPRGDNEKGLHWRRATRLGGLMVVSSTVLAVILYFFLPVLSALLFADEFKPALDIVPWLLLLLPVMATTNGPLNGLLGLGRADLRMRVYLLSAAVAIVAYVVLIPPFSWRGAVAGTAISEITLSVLAWTTLWRHQKQADAAIDRLTTTAR